MPTFDEVLVFDAIYAKCDDGSILTAIRIPVDGKRHTEWPWFVLESDSDGTPVKDTITNLVDQTGHPIYRKLFSTEELRTHWNTAEWQKGLYPPLSAPLSDLTVPAASESGTSTEFNFPYNRRPTKIREARGSRRIT